jgi:hypothetical protein
MDGQPMGPNVKKLLIEMIAVEAVPAGRGFGGALEYFLQPEQMNDVNRRAMQKVEDALDAIKAAPDNPYGTDDEVIAGAILSQIEAKRAGQRGG